MGNLTISQKIAFFWYRVFDSSGFLFNMLKDIGKPFRFLFYISFPLFFFAFLFSLFLAIKSLYPNMASSTILISSGNFFIGVALLPTLFLVLYESLYNSDMTNLRKELLKYKAAKKERWRLRNMGFAVRGVIYITSWFIGLQILYHMFLSFFISDMKNIIYSNDHISFVFTDAAEQEQFTRFFNDTLVTWNIWYGVAFIILVAGMEFSVRKKIKAALSTEC
ncbi:MAG: hypothetical protein A3F91_09815 [Flavobacteria bacterium RIFCSPLOWO2_12_FULL_35_11]|nr:MAG: hypothetical protein A3F91_09815 [Flavobacteria bacterium RIFCSPLOWO2_12_FULL_35_11]